MTSKLLEQMKGICRGIYAMTRLRKKWCGFIGNSKATFLWAFFINLAVVPIGIYLFPAATSLEETMSVQEKLLLEGLMLPVVLATVFVLTLCHRRHRKFALIYAGITYVGLIAAAVLAAVSGIMYLYGQSFLCKRRTIFSPFSIDFGFIVDGCDGFICV